MKKYLLLLLISLFSNGDNSDYVFGWSHLKDPILKKKIIFIKKNVLEIDKNFKF